MAGRACRPGWSDWSQRWKRAGLRKGVSVADAARAARAATAQEKAPSLLHTTAGAVPRPFSPGFTSGRCASHPVSEDQAPRRRLQSTSVWRVLSRVPCFSASPGRETRCFLGVVVCFRSTRSRASGRWVSKNYNSRRASREGTGRLPSDGLSEPRAEDPGSRQRREEGVRVRIEPARPGLSQSL